MKTQGFCSICQMSWPASGRCFAPSGAEHGKKGYSCGA
jgi:hypothetical protein